jgi:hypothetical protein
MIGKNNINVGDFLIVRGKMRGLNGCRRRAEAILNVCRRILDACLD